MGKKTKTEAKNKARSDLLDQVNALNSYLKPEEQLKHCEVGIKDLIPHRLIFIGLMMLGMFLIYYTFGNIFIFSSSWGFVFGIYLLSLLGMLCLWLTNGIHSMTGKTYLLGLTNSRFLVLRVKTPLLGKIDYNHKISFTEYPLGSVSFSKGKGLFLSDTITIKTYDLGKPFEVQVSRIWCGLKYDG